MRPVIVERTIDLASPPGDVWPLLTDTDRLNRLLGTHTLQVRPIEGGASSAARFVVSTQLAGFSLEYEELPFEWTYGRSFGIQRRVRRGPLRSYAVSWELSPRDGGTRVRVRLELLPRWWIIRPVAAIDGRRFLARAEAICHAIDAYLANQTSSPYVQPVTPVSLEPLRLGVRALHGAGVSERLSNRIEALLREGADADLVRLRPFEVADRWGEDRREVLSAMLRAVPAGLFELRWAVICPSCQTASEQYRTLSEIKPEGHCQLCDITFDLDLDLAVEVTLFPHPSVRRSSDQLFCIGGPARTPHVLVQANLAADETRDLAVPSVPGRYRLFVRGGAAASVDVSSEAPPRVEATAAAGGVTPAHVEVAPGGSIRLRNAAGEDRHAKIERLGYATDAATAHLVSTLPEFRELFSGDLLKRSTPLKVARVAILFSDLTGSTALYTRVGDAAAFRLVDDHFDVLRAAISRHEGVLVKTMGDAVMAAFHDAGHCVSAAVDTLERFEEFRRGRPHGDLVSIKIGMWTGACYVVTANDALDYFGQTVNVASRVQHLAEPGELIVSLDDYAQLPAAEREGLRASAPFEARVKGVDHALSLLRLRPTPDRIAPERPTSPSAQPAKATPRPAPP